MGGDEEPAAFDAGLTSLGWLEFEVPDSWPVLLNDAAVRPAGQVTPCCCGCRVALFLAATLYLCCPHSLQIVRSSIFLKQESLNIHCAHGVDCYEAC